MTNIILIFLTFGAWISFYGCLYHFGAWAILNLPFMIFPWWILMRRIMDGK